MAGDDLEPDFLLLAEFGFLHKVRLLVGNDEAVAIAELQIDRDGDFGGPGVVGVDYDCL
jgi:hypothetical protein